MRRAAPTAVIGCLLVTPACGSSPSTTPGDPAHSACSKVVTAGEKIDSDITAIRRHIAAPHARWQGSLRYDSSTGRWVDMDVLLTNAMRTRAHLIDDHPTCFKPEQVALAQTLLDEQ